MEKAAAIIRNEQIKKVRSGGREAPALESKPPEVRRFGRESARGAERTKEEPVSGAVQDSRSEALN